MVKKALFILAWGLCFYIGSSIVVGAIVGIYIGFFSDGSEGDTAKNIMLLGNAVAAILFFIAIFLGIKGTLPGTKR